ncbi:MAG: chromophore lyase CpcT/CpeT [Bacteroidota bacterium]
MKNKILLFLSLSILLWTACADRGLKAGQTSTDQTLSELVKLMSGTFSSQEQAENDSLFYNINLVMHPIWESDQAAKWLYVEQAVNQYIDKPYRQRVYRLTATKTGEIESRVYELPNPVKYIHAWDQPNLFTAINPDSLILRQGCSVFLAPQANNCYAGSTQERACTSTLRGASYATSEVTVCTGQIVSWDRGWDDGDQQVWGAETAGYIFKKIK